MPVHSRLSVFLGMYSRTVIQVYSFLGFSEITKCDKNDLVCPTGKVCKTNKTDYWCACKDGYEEILFEAENTTCKGRKIMSR